MLNQTFPGIQPRFLIKTNLSKREPGDFFAQLSADSTQGPRRGHVPCTCGTQSVFGDVIAKPCDLSAVHRYAKLDARVDELCVQGEADVDLVVSRLLRTFDGVTKLSAWSEPTNTH